MTILSVLISGISLVLMNIKKRKNSHVFATIGIISCVGLMYSCTEKYPEITKDQLIGHTWLNIEENDSLSLLFSVDSLTILTSPNQVNTLHYSLENNYLEVLQEEEVLLKWLVTIYKDSLFCTDGNELLKFFQSSK